MKFKQGDIYRNIQENVLVYITEVNENKYKLEWTTPDGKKVEKWYDHEFISMSVNKKLMELVK